MASDTGKTPMQKWRKRVILLGIILGLVCKSLPPSWQSPCHQVAQICSGGMLQ